MILKRTAKVPGSKNDKRGEKSLFLEVPIELSLSLPSIYTCKINLLPIFIGIINHGIISGKRGEQSAKHTRPHTVRVRLNRYRYRCNRVQCRVYCHKVLKHGLPLYGPSGLDPLRYATAWDNTGRWWKTATLRNLRWRRTSLTSTRSSPRREVSFRLLDFCQYATM